MRAAPFSPDLFPARNEKTTGILIFSKEKTGKKGKSLLFPLCLSRDLPIRKNSFFLSQRGGRKKKKSSSIPKAPPFLEEEGRSPLFGSEEGTTHRLPSQTRTLLSREREKGFFGESDEDSTNSRRWRIKRRSSRRPTSSRASTLSV